MAKRSLLNFDAEAIIYYLLSRAIQAHLFELNRARPVGR
jgi:hypothetical protein